MRLLPLPELTLAAIGVAAFFVAPDDLGFLTGIAITGIFVLSLSVVLGQAGIATLGQAALFGSGAYAAGLTALHLTQNPLIGLAVGGIAGAAVALASGIVMLRTHGLTFLMLSIAAAQLLYELANKAQAITGGDDGLGGFSLDPIVGLFRFDVQGRTGYLYGLSLLVAAYWLVRRLADAPFGLTCRGIRADRLRMSALGAPVFRHLLAAYVIGGFLAGLAGALTAQTTEIVGLQSLSFAQSAEALVMLVLGGAGRPAGALIGTAVFMIVHHVAAAVDPFRWMLVIGLMLIATILVLPDGLASLPARLRGRR